MRRRLSSSLTLLARTIMPTVLVCTCGGFSLWLIAARVGVGQVDDRPGWNGILVSFGVTIGLFFLFRATLRRLTWVFLEDDGLVVSTGQREFRVPLNAIRAIQDDYLIGDPIDVLILKEPMELGAEVWFLPPLRNRRMLEPHPITVELRELIGKKSQ